MPMPRMSEFFRIIGMWSSVKSLSCHWSTFHHLSHFLRSYVSKKAPPRTINILCVNRKKNYANASVIKNGNYAGGWMKIFLISYLQFLPCLQHKSVLKFYTFKVGWVRTKIVDFKEIDEIQTLKKIYTKQKLYLSL